ncbi:MAG TPA: hypothetical protein VGH20_17785 [Myxococcales bacterium]
MLWAALGGLGVLAALVARRALSIKARHLRFASEPQPEPEDSATPLYESVRALYHGTRFRDGTALLIPSWREACVCDLSLTSQALFLQREAQGARLAIALAAIEEAALHRAYAPLAKKELPMLRLRWSRGGDHLETELSLRGGMAALETLRREIHLRQGNVEEQLRPFLEKQP